MPTLAELEQWFEEQIPAHLSDLPTKVHVTLQTYTAQLREHLQDLTPSIAQIESSIPSIPSFSKSNVSSTQKITAAAPAMPLHLSLFHRLATRLDTLTGSRRRTSIVMGIALVGLASTMTHRSILFASTVNRSRTASRRLPRVRNGARCDAVVVLGADTPLGQVLSHTFASQGFIVMASVASNQSKQSFDALVPPSMRGYIKTIILPHSSTRTEHITQFVQSISSVRQLRWPLTAAGDPYARPGSEVNIVAVLNALTYTSPYEELASESQSDYRRLSATAYDVERLSDDYQRRAVVPLAVIGALLPVILQSSATTSAHSDPAQAVVLSFQHSSQINDAASQALSVRMKALSRDVAFLNAEQPQKKSIVVTSLQSRPSTLFNMVATLWPIGLGGWTVPVSSDQSATRMPTQLARASSSGEYGAPPTDSTKDVQDRKEHNKGRLNQASLLRNARQTEYRTVSLAAVEVVLRAATMHSSQLRNTYVVQLPASPSTRTHGQAVKQAPVVSLTSASGAFEAVMRQLTSVGCMLRNVAGAIPLLHLAVSPRSTCYSGTRNLANNRPAFGPGPGPASNTHSRSCIRAHSSSSSASSDHHNHHRQQGRPRSTASARSSESESGGTRDSVAPGSTPVSAPASSAHDMSSSGLLSSVPSSAFGDLSEEEHYGDSDFAEGVDSPIVGGRAGGAASGAQFQTPSSESWQHSAIASSSMENSLASSEEPDDSGTALGSRNNDVVAAEGDTGADEVETPLASRMHDGRPRNQQRTTYNGEREHVSSNANDDDAVDVARSASVNRDTSATDSAYAATSGMHSPLGQSWVALGQSSTHTGGGNGGDSNASEHHTTERR